jgi:hypothetical protein
MFSTYPRVLYAIMARFIEPEHGNILLVLDNLKFSKLKNYM